MSKKATKEQQKKSKPYPKSNDVSSFLVEDELDTFYQSKLSIINTISLGIGYNTFEKLAAMTPFDLDEWAGLLDLSIKSLQRYKKDNKTFRPIHAEKILEVAEVNKKGVDVFGNKEKFKAWLETPSFALGSLKPFELLSNSYGKELVLGELTRIDHGIFA